MSDIEFRAGKFTYGDLIKKSKDWLAIELMNAARENQMLKKLLSECIELQRMDYDVFAHVEDDPDTYDLAKRIKEKLGTIQNDKED